MFLLLSCPLSATWLLSIWKRKVAVCSSLDTLRGITNHSSNIFQYPSVYVFFISNLKGLELLSHAISERSLVYNVFPSRQSLVSARFYSLLLASTSFLPWACFHQCCDTGDNFAALTDPHILVNFISSRHLYAQEFRHQKGAIKKQAMHLMTSMRKIFSPETICFRDL